MSSITISSSAVDAFGLNTNPQNTAPSQSKDDLDKKKKKKKKRSREDEKPGVAETGESESRKKRKKTAEIDPQLLNGESAAGTAVASAPSKPLEVDAPPKKKKRKGKEKAKITPLAEQTDAEIEAHSQASAAALLSAIVAASATHQPAQTQPSFDPQSLPPGHAFMQFPMVPVHYGFPVPPGAAPFDPNNPQNPIIFAANSATAPASNAAPATHNAFSELAFGSNEDVLRALRDLDMSKIANVLKSLGEAASSSNGVSFPAPMPFMPAQMDQQASGQPSIGVMAFPNPQQTISTTGHKRTVNMSLPGNEHHARPNHAYVLANKWLNTSKLAELVVTEGLVYKKGKFSAIEEQQIKSAIERFQIGKQMTHEEVMELIFSKNDKNKDTAFWSELTAAVPLRPIIAVYHHVRRSYHPMKLKGQWQPNEDADLKQAIADLGQQWEKVSERVGRMSADCRDRYRNHIVNSDIRVTGYWTKEEEEKLTQIVTDMTVKQGRDTDNDVFWGKVSELMGGKRGRQQCRIKWTDALSKTIKNQGQKPRWNPQDAFILVHKVDSLNVRDDSEIDWKLISDPDWNLWSAHTLQRRWLTLKKSVKGYEDMTHQEIMDILRIKKAHLPAPTPPSTRKRKERKVTSAPAVTEPDSRDSNATTPEAGSSSGPGTLNNVTQAGTSEDDDSTDTDAGA